jgi:hypothetical protein
MKSKPCAVKKASKAPPVALAKRMAEVQLLKLQVRLAEATLRPKMTLNLR